MSDTPNLLMGKAITTAIGKVVVAPLADGDGFQIDLVTPKRDGDSFVAGTCEDDESKGFLAFSLSREGAEALVWLLCDALDYPKIPEKP